MESYLDALSNALAKENHDVRVVTRFVKQRPTPLSRLFRAAEAPRTYQRGRVSVRVVAPAAPRRVLLRPTYRLHHHEATQGLAIELFVHAFRPSLRTALDGCDVVHFSGTGREMLGFAAARVADELGVPFIVTPHMHVGSWGDGAFDFRLYRDAQAVIALTDYERRVLEEEGGVARDRIFVQGHGVNVSGTGNGAQIREHLALGDHPVVLFLGRKSAYKGFPLLLNAAEHIWNERPETRFVFAGPDDDTLVLPDDTARVLEDARVTLLGFVSDDVREDLYAACDVFCLPSEAEAFGLVYVEAGSYGTPVVALDIPTLRELIADTNRGLLVAPTAADVAAALLRILDNPELRSTLGENGRRQAAGQRWSDVAQNMARLYRDASVKGGTESPRAMASSNA